MKELYFSHVTETKQSESVANVSEIVIPSLKHLERSLIKDIPILQGINLAFYTYQRHVLNYVDTLENCVVFIIVYLAITMICNLISYLVLPTVQKISSLTF